MPLAAGPEGMGLSWIRPPGTEADYAGNDACRSCHAAEFTSHARTLHARTVRKIAPKERRAEFKHPQTVPDPVRGVEYSVRADQGSDQMVVRRGARSLTETPRWLFGSGTHAWTYLSETKSGFMELRLSFYPRTREWNFTPGQGPQVDIRQPLGQSYSPAEAASCFGCHSTVLVGTPERLDLRRSILNVGCESCHGPSRRHVDAATSAASSSAEVARPPKVTGAAVMDLCGKCHREPFQAPQGQTTDEAQLPRFPGIALARSRCFTESEGKLTCTTCHNPHEPAPKAATAYDPKCKGCHTPPHGSTCAAGKVTNCVTCHLPEQSIARKLPLRFHNHWIRRAFEHRPR